MRILAIETSCDETAVALMDISGEMPSLKIRVLANSLFSQAHLHEQYGGVYPNLAKREHTKNLPILLERTLREATSPPAPLLDQGEGGRRSGEVELIDSIDYICVTQGPGLEPALWVGITFAEELGQKWGIPVIPVDHMEGHIWSVLYANKPKFSINNLRFTKKPKLAMPALALLVSGGHTELVLVEDFGQYKILGKTRDDAVGEAFDKVARILGLGYPGGPQISKLAEEARGEEAARHEQATAISFPKPMINSGDLDFSYSGLKTAVLYHVKNSPPSSEGEKAEIARAFEDAAVEVLVEKSRQALEAYPEIRSFILGGGVAANKHLQRELAQLLSTYPKISFFQPEKDLITDNALMIGIAGYINIKLGAQGNSKLKAQGNLSLNRA